MVNLYKLQNGMEVLLEENHAAPVISYHLVVKIGSVMEKSDEAGLCHLIEHMLFKGTPKRPVGAIAKEVEAAGGEINAYTSFDQTVYYINMASKFKDRGLEILADAIQNPLFDKEELDREKEVILEEIRRENDNPSHRVSELLFTNSFTRHPYKNPIIGTEKSVRSFTREKIMDFYRQWYAPQNISLVIVGAFHSKEMLKDVNKRFNAFRKRAIPERSIPREPSSKALSIHLEENSINAVYFAIGFNIPEIVHSDIPALDVLSHILAGTDSSRLEQEVKEKKQLVNAVYSYAFAPKYPGILIVGGLTSPQKINNAITAIADEIHKLHFVPIGSSELNRAKLNIRSSEIYERETTGGQAGKYAYFISTTGSHEYEKKYFQNLQEVHKDDITRVAQKYLTPENATMIIVSPKGKSKLINTAKIKLHVNRMKPTPKSKTKVAKHIAPPIVHRLPNGIRLAIQEVHTLPIVSCSAVVHGGTRFENKANNGINILLSEVITKGTKYRNAVQIAESIESIAGGLSSSSGRNSFGLKTEFLSDKFGEGFNLFAEILTQPSFDPKEISKEKAQQIDAIKNQEDILSTLAYIKFLETIYPHHPYGLRMLGTKSTVKKLERRELISYFERLMNPEDMVVSVVGDISPDEVIKEAETKLVFAKSGTKRFKAPRAETPPKKSITVEFTRPEKEQAHIITGFLGPRINSRDHYAIAVLNNILSGQGGKLFLNLRDKMSLAYAVSSSYFSGIEPGFIAIYIGTEPSKIDTAIAGIRSELKSVIEKGVTGDELERSKSHIIGTHCLDRQRVSALAANHSLNILLGLGVREIDELPKKIGEITAKDVARVARKYLTLNNAITTIIRPA